MSMKTQHMPTQQTGSFQGWRSVLRAVACILLLASSAGYAQKGMGDQTGVVRQGLRPSLTRLSGKILSVETHPCEKATGRALAGTHLIIEAANGRQYNLHVGPADAVASVVEPLQPGRPVEVVAFRTSRMPENQYVVSTLLLKNSKAVTLRDADLRPFWAGRSRFDGDGNQGRAGSGKRRGFRFRSRRQSVRPFGPWHGPRRGSGRCIF
jgi:hypothetical protein